MLDDILDTGVLPNAAHAHTVGVVTPQVLHENVGGIGLGREAVVTNVDAGVGHAETVHVQ